MPSPGCRRVRPYRWLLFASRAVGTLLALACATPALAQTPTKVTITGSVDNASSWTRNMSLVDLNYARSGDTEWYARTRARPDVIAEVGTTKFVLGLEIDFTWGQTGAADVTGPQRSGATSGADLNTDLLGNIELKWAYVEFDVPSVPRATRLRLGAQPFAVTYKPGLVASGDFGGAHAVLTATPWLKLGATWAQVEEESTGPNDGFARGEDWAVILTAELTPRRGLEVKPVYALFAADGTTSGAARQGRGGLGTGATTYAPVNIETRHTIGVDARWRHGSVSVEPSVLYQWGEREITPGAPFAGEGPGTQDRSAWLVDLRGGWRHGPLLVEGLAAYATGDRASEDVRSTRQTVRYFEPIDTDTNYLSGWSEILAKNVEDNVNLLYANAPGLNLGAAPTFDKYGLVRAGARASYALVPSFIVRAAVGSAWTAHPVDTSSALAAATGLTPGDGRGDARHLGVELDVGAQWRLAPGLTLDVVGAYLWAGDALSESTATSTNGITRNARDPSDVQAMTAKLRYSF
ncbi:MAG: hypothetical protein HYR51_09340 [Candidatus Rokubacteria bacterium]|nr:hypothetical protein [Candidatus Rokubacteria bacterium]